MEYYIENSESNKWESCNAKTEKGAKMLAEKTASWMLGLRSVGIDKGQGVELAFYKSGQNGTWLAL